MYPVDLFIIVGLVLVSSFCCKVRKTNKSILPLYLLGLDAHQYFKLIRNRKSEERSISSVLFVYSSNCFHALNRG